MEICTLCLKEIGDEETVVVNERLRHKSCSENLEEMILELEEIYESDQHKEDNEDI